MKTEESNNYRYILEEFGSDVVEKRTNWLKELMDSYMRQENLEETAFVSEEILFHVIIDYFADIYRLKSFHGINKTNLIKIYAYTTFWILRHKPIQLKYSISEDYVFINELFCTELIRSFLFDNPSDVAIRNEDSQNINDFINTLLYYFKYRDYSAKSIELMLTAFNAGRGFQKSVDFQT